MKIFYDVGLRRLLFKKQNIFYNYNQNENVSLKMLCFNGVF